MKQHNTDSKKFHFLDAWALLQVVSSASAQPSRSAPAGTAGQHVG